MKKKTIFIIIAAILLIILLYYAYSLLKLNIVDGGDFIMQASLGEKVDQVGVFDKNLYYKEDNKLIGYNDKKGKLFERHIGFGKLDLIYDKYIYLGQEDGIIRAFDRFDGRQITKLDLGQDIYHLELVDKKLQAYGKNDVYIIDLKLKDYRKESFDFRPVKYREDGPKSSIIFLDRDLNGLMSRIKIMENGKESYGLSSVDELFMYTQIMPDGSCLYMTNSYLYLIKDGKLQKKTFLMSPKSIDVQGEKIALIDHDRLKIYNKDLGLEEEIALGFVADKLAIYEDKIAIIADNIVASYEDGNLLKTDVKGMKDYYHNRYGIYIVFADHVEKLKGY